MIIEVLFSNYQSKIKNKTFKNIQIKMSRFNQEKCNIPHH